MRIVALDDERMTERLRDDHANARTLAEGLATVEGLHLNPERVKTNMVYFDLDPVLPFDAAELCKRAATERVKISPTAPRRIRMVTHCYVSHEEAVEAAQAIAHVIHHWHDQAANGKVQAY